MPQPSRPSAFSFNAVERRIGRNRLYRVYVGENFVAGGARLAGNVYDEMSFLFICGNLWFVRRLFGRWKERQFAARAVREAYYDNVDPAAQDLRDFDPQNFHYTADDLVRLGFRYDNMSMIASAVGKLRITPFDGPARTLTVMDYAEPDAVIAALRRLDRRLEVSGKLGYESIVHREETLVRRYTLRGGITCLVLGIAAAALWGSGMVTNPKLIYIAVAFPIFGLQMLREHRQMTGPTRAG